MTGQVCLTAEEAATQNQNPLPAVTLEDFRRIPWPPGVVHIQPTNGRTLVNVPTNVYLDAITRTQQLNLLGQNVTVRATPTTYTWNFGDGAKLRTSDPGHAYPDLRTTHTYTAPATTIITLTTTYRGDYSINGGPWIPIDGTVDIPTAPVPLTVIATHNELVASPLPG